VAAFNRSREEFLERNQPKDKPPIVRVPISQALLCTIKSSPNHEWGFFLLQGLVTIPTANVLPPLQPMKHYDAPASALTTAKYRIYKDLWSKGLFVMTGNRFHVDFVIYKGSPGWN
jgi:tRNA splicing endonuclease